MDFSKKKSVSWSVPVLKVGRDFNFLFLYCFFFSCSLPSRSSRNIKRGKTFKQPFLCPKLEPAR